MKYFKLSLLLMMLIVLAWMFIGCAKAPEAEQAAAKSAMEAAKAAGADRYATAEFIAAKKIWDEAEALVQAKKYEEAKQGYIDAKAAFEKSAGGIEAGKKAFTEQAITAVAGLEAGWKDLEAMAKKFEYKLEKKKLWEGDTKIFLEGLQSAREMISTDPAKAIEKAGQLKTFLDSYSVIFKQLAAAPAKSPAVRKKAKRHEE